ncbi:MAG: hypothetical protein PUP93_27220 [Rhizonema sp. NSF051]|nr:hypothetical protein [Rhizonema sp. NSF051]
MDIITKYPLLSRRLVGYAAHRISQTTEHLECEVKGEIIYLSKQENLLAFSMPIMKRSSEFVGGAVPMYVVAAEAGRDKGIIAVQKEIRLQQQRLADIKRSLVLPSVADYRRAEDEVQEYLKTLPNLTPEILEQFPISAREKYHLSKIPGLFATWQQRDSVESWSYGSEGYSALVEPMLQSFRLEDKEIGYITRNSYGVRCLNAINVMFIDIDLPPGDFMDFSKKAMPWGNAETEESQILAAIRDLSSDWGLSFEVYRTRNGYRLIEMSRLWEPLSAQSSAVLETLGSDRLYQKLCQVQNCYRARLQKKPWRSGNGICKHVATYSDGAPNHPEAEMIKGIHDSWCLSGDILA